MPNLQFSVIKETVAHLQHNSFLEWELKEEFLLRFLSSHSLTILGQRPIDKKRGRYRTLVNGKTKTSDTGNS